MISLSLPLLHTSSIHVLHSCFKIKGHCSRPIGRRRTPHASSRTILSSSHRPTRYSIDTPPNLRFDFILPLDVCGGPKYPRSVCIYKTNGRVCDKDLHQRPTSIFFPFFICRFSFYSATPSFLRVTARYRLIFQCYPLFCKSCSRMR